MKSAVLIFGLMLWGTDNLADTVQGTLDVSMNVVPSCELDIPKPWRKNPHKFRKQIRKWLERNPHCTGQDLPPEFDDDFDDDLDDAHSKKSWKSGKNGKSSTSDKSKKSDKSQKSDKSSTSKKSSKRKTLTVNY